MTDKALIIDGSSILFRAYYALPEMTTYDGKSTNGVLGFFNILFKSIELIDPKYIAICLDLSGPTFRNDLYKEYKGQRKPTPKDLKEQFSYVKEILDVLDFSYFELENYEADDIAGTLAKNFSRAKKEVYLLTGDKDYLQLVDENIKMLYTKRGVSELVEYTEDEIYKEYNIKPEQIIDMLGLMGDPSDNIPGISGVGQKTAIKLLNEFGSIDNLYENTDKLRDNKTNQKIIASEDIAKLSRDLATIDCQVPINFEEEILEIKDFDDEKVYEVLQKYQLKSLISRLNLDSSEKTEEKIEYKINKDTEPFEIRDLAIKNKRIAFKIYFDKMPYEGGSVKKIAFLIGEDIYINKLEDNLGDYREIFEDDQVEVISYGLKEDMIFLIDKDISISSDLFDILIGEYLLSPTDSSYYIDDISQKYGLSIDLDEDDLKEVKKENYQVLSDESIDKYLVGVLTLIDQIFEKQISQLEELSMLELYKEIEIPLIEVLGHMQYRGVLADQDELLEIGKNLELEIEILVNTIYSLAGMEFNINSPKQLGQVLFEKLDLPVIKKTKTGYSTSIEVLEELEDKHEIISYIMRYRTLSKLKNTYVDGMLPHINEDTGRIHSNFNQTVTATGRLSSTKPNLQNIPIRTDEGRILRKIFISQEGYSLVDADYSQIELRILAYVSDDKNMIEAFNNNQDIHQITASNVFDVDLEDVSPLMRLRAKAVNFGIVYGISDYGLSQDLKISRAEAKDYIDSYLDRFEGVANYMDEIVETAKDQGYVKTKFERRRYLPELKSSNWNTQKFGERIALNMPIQGTAADIIKIAMIRVHNRLKEEKLESKLILQIHDELIVEAKNDELEVVKNIVKEEMENAAKLTIPLVSNITVGDSWYDAQ